MNDQIQLKWCQEPTKPYTSRITKEAWEPHKEAIVAQYEASTLESTRLWMNDTLGLQPSYGAMSLPQEQNANWLERTSFESSSRNGASQNTKRGLPSALKPLALSHVQRGPISTEKMVLSQKTHRIPLNTSVCNSTPSEKDPTLFLALSEQPRDRNCLAQHEAMLSVTRVRETNLFPGKPPRGVES
jgi:hypothetical protein